MARINWKPFREPDPVAPWAVNVELSREAVSALQSPKPDPTPPSEDGRGRPVDLDELDRQIEEEAAQGIDPDPTFLSPRRPPA
jgi:hypothetical protein